MSITTLRIKKEYKDKLEIAVKWYSLMSILNDFSLAPLDVHIIAFTAIEGNISSGGKKDRFCELFHYAKGSVTNTISELVKKGFLVKETRKIKVHPQLILDFNNNILLQLNISSIAVGT